MENYTLERSIYGRFEVMTMTTVPRSRDMATETPPQVNSKHGQIKTILVYTGKSKQSLFTRENQNNPCLHGQTKTTLVFMLKSRHHSFPPSFSQLNDCVCNRELEDRVRRTFVNKRMGLLGIIGVALLLMIANISAISPVAHSFCMRLGQSDSDWYDCGYGTSRDPEAEAVSRFHIPGWDSYW